MFHPLFDITGSRAIVTGGTRGLGHGVAEGLLEAGARVVIFGTSAKVYKVAEDFRAKALTAKGLLSMSQIVRTALRASTRRLKCSAGLISLSTPQASSAVIPARSSRWKTGTK